LSYEVTKVEIDHLKKSHEELKSDIQALTATVNKLNEQLLEIRLGRRWLLGMLSASAVAGALVDTLMRLLKIY
jgi:hypothetical protein